MAPVSRRRPAPAAPGGKDAAATEGGKAPLSPAGNGSPGSPVVISPRGAGGGGAGGGGGLLHHHHHHHKGQNNNNINQMTSLDLDALDDDAAAARFDAMSESVVKIFCIHSEPAFNQPWTKRRQTSSTSSGFAIPGRRILTNAHSVDHHVSVKCRRRGSDAKVVARVLAVGVECDLALIAVDDDEFWRGLEGVKMCRSLPRLQESVSVCGFPLGGDTLSVTSGVVSRCETTSYVHSGTGSELCAIQIDASINSGNSGGPVFNGRGECVGVAFQSMAGSGEAEGVSLFFFLPLSRSLSTSRPLSPPPPPHFQTLISLSLSLFRSPFPSLRPSRSAGSSPSSSSTTSSRTSAATAGSSASPASASSGKRWSRPRCGPRSG